MLEWMGYDTGLDVEGLIRAAGSLRELVGRALHAQVSQAGPRLRAHNPPDDFETIRARALARDASRPTT